MEAEYERRLIRSMSGCSSVSSSPFSSPISSPSPIKHSDRFIPLRSLSQPSAFFIDQEQIHKGPMLDKKSSRDSTSSTTNSGTNTSSTANGTTIAADRTKDILTYQALLQNEVFGTQIDSLYDEQHTTNTYSNNNSNNHNLTNTPNQTVGNNDTNNNGGTITTAATTTVIGHGLGGQMYTTAISGISVRNKILFQITKNMYVSI
jgi:hypothetical protein